MNNFRTDSVRSMQARRAHAAKVSRIFTIVLIGMSIVTTGSLAYVALKNSSQIDLPGFASESSSAPSTSEIHSAVELEFRRSDQCTGELTIKHLNISRVGDYMPRFGGFPVYGSFAIGCRKGKVSSTNTSSTDQTAAITFVRRSFKGWEAFTPDIFKRAQNEMSSSFNKMINNIR